MKRFNVPWEGLISGIGRGEGIERRGNERGEGGWRGRLRMRGEVGEVGGTGPGWIINQRRQFTENEASKTQAKNPEAAAAARRGESEVPAYLGLHDQRWPRPSLSPLMGVLPAVPPPISQTLILVGSARWSRCEWARRNALAESNFSGNKLVLSRCACFV